MPEIPDLVIPIRLDDAGAIRSLANVGQKGTEAGDAVAKAGEVATDALDKIYEGFNRFSKGAQKSKEESHGLGAEFGEILKAGMELVAVEAVLEGLAEAARKTAEYVQKQAEKFVELREEAAKLAALQGKVASDQFTAQQAGEAKAAGLPPSVYVEAQVEAQRQIGPLAEGPFAKLKAEPGKKPEDAMREMATHFAQFGEPLKLPPDLLSGLASSVLRYAKEPMTVKQVEDVVGKTYSTLKKAGVAPERMLRDLDRVQALGLSAPEAAQAVGVVAPATGGRGEAMGVEAVVKAMDTLKREGRAEEYGIGKDQTTFENVKNFAANINERMQKAQAAGQDPQAALKDLLTGAKIGGGQEERAIRGMATLGIRQGGFARMQGYAEGTPEDFLEQQIKKGEESDAGRYRREKAAQAAIEVEKAAKVMPAEALREHAKTELMEEDRWGPKKTWSEMYQSGQIGDVGRRWAEKGTAAVPILGSVLGTIGLNVPGTGVTPEQQAINERAYQDAQKQRGLVPGPISDVPFVRGLSKSEYGVIGPGATQNEATFAMLDQLKRQTELLEEQKREREKRETGDLPARDLGLFMRGRADVPGALPAGPPARGRNAL